MHRLGLALLSAEDPLRAPGGLTSKRSVNTITSTSIEI
jgi:hypothetical protein